MCELFGASFNKQAGIQFAFNNFRKRGRNNPHGWGLAWYPDDKSSQIIKEAKPAAESPMSKFLTTQNTLKSKVFISHVRVATGGTDHIHRNTHPFNRILNRKEYVFAHNGSLRNFEELELSGYFPLGKTDSEHAFCSLLSSIRQAGARRQITWSDNKFLWLQRKLASINSYGNFNCIFSDGEHLFCYKCSSYNSLKYVQRKAPFHDIKYKDSEQEVSLSDDKDPSQKGYIISTRQLSEGEEWNDFENGQLIVFKDGEIIFKST